MTTLGDLVKVLLELGPRVGAGAALLLTPANAGQRGIMQLNEFQRFETRPGELRGSLQELDGNDQWQTVKTGVQLVQVGSQRMALTDEEIRGLQAPLINLPPNGPPAGVPALPLPDWADRPEVGTPGYEAAAPAGPTTTTTPIAGQDWRDLLIEQSNSENNRDLAQERFRNNPSLQDPSKLAGTKIPGVGTWGYPGTPRGNDGAEYGEQINGVPAGLELNVGGVPNAQGVITGGAWIDGVEIRNGQTVLIERKDWGRYPPLGANFWHTETVKQAIRQIDAAQQIGAKVEWHVSTQAAADAVSALFNARAKLEDVRLTQIDIRVVPKK